MQFDGVAVPIARIVAGPRALCASLISSKYAIFYWKIGGCEDQYYKQGNNIIDSAVLENANPIDES